jgi:hypothetical protein
LRRIYVEEDAKKSSRRTRSAIRKLGLDIEELMYAESEVVQGAINTVPPKVKKKRIARKTSLRSIYTKTSTFNYL